MSGAVTRVGDAAEDRGKLRPLPDPDRAALYLVLLVSTNNPSYRGEKPSQQEIVEIVPGCVRAFLYGYRP